VLSTSVHFSPSSSPPLHVGFERVEDHVQAQPAIDQVLLPERQIVTKISDPFEAAFGDGSTQLLLTG